MHILKNQHDDTVSNHQEQHRHIHDNDDRLAATTTTNEECADESPSDVITTKTYIFVLCAALNSCNLGYDMGVSTEASKLIQVDWDLSDVQRQIFVGSINFWASTFPALP